MLQHWSQAITDIWGLECSLSRLDGEYDLNFMVATSTKQYVLKVMRPDCEPAFVDMQCLTLEHLHQQSHSSQVPVPAIPVPEIITTIDGRNFAFYKDPQGQQRIVWLVNKFEGLNYAHFQPKSEALIHQLGSYMGHMASQLESFEHAYLDRDFKWNLVQAGWIEDQLDCMDSPQRKAIISSIVEQFKALQANLSSLPLQCIHNDVNDYNILVQGSLSQAPHISGIIDFGDMCLAPRVCDLAIAGAYMVLDQAQPAQALAQLVAGFHASAPLTAMEVALVWPLLRMRLAVSVVNSTLMALDNPDDPYITISQGPAWDFLQKHNLHAGLIEARLRLACGMPVSTTAESTVAWLNQHSGAFHPLMGASIDLSQAPMVELSVEHSSIPQNPFAIQAHEAQQLIGKDVQLALGYYLEPRLVYTDKAFKNGPWPSSNRRTVHLGLDVFAPAGSALYVPLAATVETIDNRKANLDYGGVVILRHQTPAGDVFYSLYGHLDPSSLVHLSVGQQLIPGDLFARLGEPSHNGGWDPHVHVQLALFIEGMGYDWPGAADPDDLQIWQSLCPNPAALLNLDHDRMQYCPPNKDHVQQVRKDHFGHNLKLSYAQPVMFLRGWRHYLFDEWGRPYLDAYNNVPHVGHAHPRIAKVAAEQLLRINTNSRYLHPSRSAFAQQILSHMPDDLSVCYFVNSGTEANELALRLARAHTKAKHMITPNHGYHGNTTGAIDISAYKFASPRASAVGLSQPGWVHLVDVADDYRGQYRRDNLEAGELYAQQVAQHIATLKAGGEQLSGFIAETFPSVGGQIIPPQGYLQHVYKHVRGAGGVCIADEVQTGLGRLGDYYFAFEQQKVVPDIVVLGKPIGNGHPIGVVITSPAIAASFAEGPEFFSTFGGSNLSCVVGAEVLRIVEDEQLMSNARDMGNLLFAGLRKLQEEHECIGDVRGYGLFVGVDLVSDQASRQPATQIADYVKNRMREQRILMGSEGPADNVLKIRPPLTIGAQDINYLLHTLDQVLHEVKALAG
jgi:4-aminobutyrate aminotransferase-like enzyme/Ser/Thr protein kinase RdoA (MazF antagonist)